MSGDNDKIKEELVSLYNSIYKELPNNKLPENIKEIKDIQILDIIKLITNIKELIPILINHKISESAHDNNKEEKSILKSQYLQLESQLTKLEYAK